MESATETTRGVLSRRTVLKGLAGAGLVSLPALLGACDAGRLRSGSPAIAPSAPASAPVPSTSRPSPTPAAGLTLATIFPGGFERLIDAFTQETQISVKVRTEDAASFQDTIIPYLQASPEDVFSWGAARTRNLANQGLVTEIDDVWSSVAGHFPELALEGATATDHHQYFMPIAAYAWAFFYRPSLFEERGYAVPSTWADFKKLAARMQKDGLVPIAMGDAELFEAMGTFDALDLRQNGCAFHLRLLAGSERWTDPKVRDVFERWREITPYTQPGATGRSFGEAATDVMDKKAGMYLMGTEIMLGSGVVDDLDIFPFPNVGTAWDAEGSFDLAVDGFAVSRNSPTLADHADNARAFIEFLAKGSTQTMFSADQIGSIALANDADTSGYNRVQKKVQAMLGSAKRVAEFLDRDSDPRFTYQLGPALQDFLADPNQDLDAFLTKVQGFWDNR
jgi:multiple sugar transport system substrate-binding protein